LEGHTVAEKKGPTFAAIDEFTADRFTATQWEPAEHKAEFARAFIGFVESDFDRRKFTDKFYRRLSNTFGHIAHYNRAGFYDTFFTTTEDKVRFLRQTADHTCAGDPACTYSDVERALQAWMSHNSILTRYEQRLAESRCPKMTQAQWDALPEACKGFLDGKPIRLALDEKTGATAMVPVEIIREKGEQPVQVSKGKPEENKDHSQARANAREGAQIIAAASHRNGVCGAPFGVVLFEDDGQDRSRKVGIWFEPGVEGCHCAVLDVDKLAAGDIAFLSNSWRGDLYEPLLRTVVEQIGREEQWRPVFGPDYWEKRQTPGPIAELKGSPKAEATRQTEQPLLTLVPEASYPTLAWLDLGRFSSKLVAARNPHSEAFTYTARLFCDDRPAFLPMHKHDLRSLQLLTDDRGLSWLHEHLAERRFPAPTVKDLQQFQEIVRVNEALIGRFIEQGHKAVLQEQKLAEELDLEVLEIEPGQGEQQGAKTLAGPAAASGESSQQEGVTHLSDATTEPTCEPRTDCRANEPYQVIDTRGIYQLVARGPADSRFFALLENGKVLCTEKDGDHFYERVGMVSASWELALATGALQHAPEAKAPSEEQSPVLQVRTTAPPEDVLVAIAHEQLGIATLETRNSDSLDFHDVSVWALKEALLAAYQAGAKKQEAAHQARPGYHADEAKGAEVASGQNEAGNTKERGEPTSELHSTRETLARMELGKLRGEVYRNHSQPGEYYSVAVRRPLVGKDGTETLAFDTWEHDIKDHITLLREAEKTIHQDRLERAPENGQTQENRVRVTRR
jgi:hypothetical protein